MADENKQANEQADVSIQDLQTQIAEMRGLIEQKDERHKSELAGLNRRNSELEKKLLEEEAAAEEAKQAKLSDKERMQAEIDQIKNEAAAAKREKRLAENKAEGVRLLEEAGLPTKLVSKLTLDNGEGLEEEVKELAEIIGAHTNSKLVEQSKQYGHEPPTGSQPVEVPKKLTRELSKAQKIAYLKAKHKRD